MIDRMNMTQTAAPQHKPAFCIGNGKGKKSVLLPARPRNSDKFTRIVKRIVIVRPTHPWLEVGERLPHSGKRLLCILHPEGTQQNGSIGNFLRKQSTSPGTLAKVAGELDSALE